MFKAASWKNEDVEQLLQCENRSGTTLRQAAGKISCKREIIIKATYQTLWQE